MTKKNKNYKSIKQALKEKDVQRSFVKDMKKRKDTNESKNQAWNSDVLESTDDLKNLRRLIVKEFFVIRKSESLIFGTNEVLRMLEKGRLIAVFIFKDKGSSAIIKESLLKLCKQTGVYFTWLEENDRQTLGPEFPKSITYGIKKDPFTSLHNLKSLLQEYSLKITKKHKHNVNEDNKAFSYTNISLCEIKLSSTKEATKQEFLDTSTFYHTHEGNISKKSSTHETGFLSLNKFSTDEKETNFLDYDSVACSGVLYIK